MHKNINQNLDQIINQMELYCVKQDRCKWDIYHKLKSSGLDQSIIDSIINKQEKEEFINEERYSRSFSRGKFRIKKWGKIKIKNA